MMVAKHPRVLFGDNDGYDVKGAYLCSRSERCRIHSLSTQAYFPGHICGPRAKATKKGVDTCSTPPHFYDLCI